LIVFKKYDMGFLIRGLGLALLIIFMIAGCSVVREINRQNQVVSSRYADQKHGRNTYLISYQGPVYSTVGHINRILLMRAAQLTIESGNTFFMLFPLSPSELRQLPSGKYRNCLLPGTLIRVVNNLPQYCQVLLVKIIPGFSKPAEPAYNARILLKLNY
jgi:hypothetical protein